MFRVICTSKVFGKEKTSVVWEGESIHELSREYPPSKIFGADPLGHWELEDGYVTYDCHFEKLECGTWTKVKDPRIRLQKGLSKAEREIDQENRRLFPGDYL